METERSMNADPETVNPAPGFARPLMDWYQAHHRDLPFRRDREPYHIWVSEIMAQQTRIEAMVQYYDRFMTLFPTVQDLAAADEDTLHRAWQGLGYYSRVRNLQKAAQIVAREGMPRSKKELQTLPGIGPYTAGAIASISFGEKAAAVDGNVLRVLARVKASYEDILKQSVKSSMEKEVRKIIPADRAGDFNQALIELGAIVCVPNGKARCGACPLAFCCMAREKGIVDELPKKKAKKERRLEQKTVLVLREGDRVGIRKRSAKGLLAGMYELPNLEGFLGENEVLEWIRKQGLSPLRILPLAGAKHIFSHVEWQMTGYAVSLEETEHMDRDGLFFTDAKETEEKYPIPAAFAAYARYMDIVLGQERYEER